MASEKQDSGVSGFMDEFIDEGIKDAGLSEEDVVTDSPGQDDSTSMQQQDGTSKQAEPEEEIVEKEAADSSQEDIEAALKSAGEEEEPQSVISSLLPTVEDVEKSQKAKSGYVPVEDHVKLRERAQRAEQERDELRSRLEATSTGGEKPGTAEKSPLEQFAEENPDEDFVPVKVQIAQKKWEDARQAAREQARERQLQTQRDEAAKRQQTADSINAMNQKAVNAEKEFRKNHEDYDRITLPVLKAGLWNNNDRLAVLQAENPAQKFYEICKGKLEALGIAPKNEPAPKSQPKASDKKQSAQKEQIEPKAEEDMTDDELFVEIYGEPEY